MTNKPIDNYVLQNNLDCGAHELTNINSITSNNNKLSKNSVFLNSHQCRTHDFQDMYCSSLMIGSRGCMFNKSNEYDPNFIGAVFISGTGNSVNLDMNAGNCGSLIVGGKSVIHNFTNGYQSILSVGGEITVEPSSQKDSILTVGSANGFRFTYDGYNDSSTMMMNGKTVNVQYSQTITHEAPFTGEITEYSIGDPVFASGL